MSSTSSSECECNQYWPNYETGHNAKHRNAFESNPFYPTMGHPLVYYAQCPPKLRGRNRERGNPNCFVKAFRWYTKEHIPNRSGSPNKPDMSGFATWLDIKYDQFLLESQMSSDMYHVKVKQTFEAGRVPTNNNCEPCAPKRFPGKSPWKKKQRARSYETAAVRQKSNQSCRYIMQPKDVSRPPSVCCHPSNATTTVSECGKKPLGRSQSFSNMTMVIKGKEPCNALAPPCNVCDMKPKDSVCKTNSCKKINSNKPSTEKIEVTNKNKATISQDFGCQCGEGITTKANAETQYDVVVPPNSRRGSLPSDQSQRLVNCECAWPVFFLQRPTLQPTSRIAYGNTIGQPVLPSVFSPGECACKSLDTMPRRPISRQGHVVNTSKHSQRNVKPKSYKNVECQCPEEKVVSVDAQTQHVPRPASGFKSNICECDFKGFLRNYQTPVQSVPMPSIQLPLYSGDRKVKEELVLERVKFAQTTSQTSNHSICFEQEIVHEYPFFLKIVCADKLSNQNMKRL